VSSSSWRQLYHKSISAYEMGILDTVELSRRVLYFYLENVEDWDVCSRGLLTAQ